MIDLPREVFADDELSATEYNKLVRALRAMYPVQGPGVHLERTPNGTIFSAKTASRKSAGAVVKGGCFDIDAEGKFVNRYYRVGNMPKEAPEFTDTATAFAGKFVALSVPVAPDGTPSLSAFTTFEGLATAARDPKKALAPLYKFDAEGNIEVDLRNMPIVQAVEILAP